MRDVFNSATSFNQDLSDWNVSAVTNMIMPLANTPALSDVNKGLIHGTFSKNPNWPYDWSAYHTKPAHVVPSAANLRMLWVQPGTFTMGSPVTEAGRDTDETEHNVTLTEGFYLGKYEVTQAQYEAVMTGNTNGLSATPSQFGGNPNRPVERFLGMMFKSSSPASTHSRRPTSPRAGPTSSPPRLNGNTPAGPERLRRIRGGRRSISMQTMGELESGETNP